MRYGRIGYSDKEVEMKKCYDCDGTGYLELNQVMDISFVDETFGAICTECDGFGVVNANV